MAVDSNSGGGRAALDERAQSSKSTLKVPDVDYFLVRLCDFPDLMPEYAHHRVYGAVAYLKSHESVNVHAARQGLFVIRATGSSATITNADGFTPRTFGRPIPAAGGAADSLS